MTTIQSSSLPQSSSLQRALATAAAAAASASASAAAAAATEKNQGKKDFPPGAFENCFSTGLDLSEFTVASQSDDVVTRTASASSQLLRIKCQERNKRRQEEQEDFKMEQMLQNRLTALRPSDDANQKKSSPACSPSVVMDALVQMHGGDETYKRPNPGKAITKQKSSLRKLSGSTQRHPAIRHSNNKNNPSKQRVVTKKSRRNKY
jgi:hypothetical protein